MKSYAMLLRAALGRGSVPLRFWCLVLLTLALTGCGGNLKLVQRASEASYDGEVGWYARAVQLDSRIEALITRASLDPRGVAQDGDTVATRLEQSGGVDLMAVIENVERTQERFGMKRITYARVKEGKILRVSSPQEEPAPDAAFLRTVYLAATRAYAQTSTVIPYNDPRGSVTMRATSTGKCHVTVKVIDGSEYGGELLYTVKHNICQERQPIEETASN